MDGYGFFGFTIDQVEDGSWCGYREAFSTGDLVWASGGHPTREAADRAVRDAIRELTSGRDRLTAALVAGAKARDATRGRRSVRQ